MLRVFYSMIVLGAVLTPVAGLAEPFRPTAPDQILERLPTPGDAVTRELRRLRADLSDDPNNL
ncbi:MAG: hypothetical protein O7B24_04850, partial [Alphaproteobacteria bacterium]|nr:hypothetical protein [Alphaproteobacteria bacterium]